MDWASLAPTGRYRGDERTGRSGWPSSQQVPTTAPARAGIADLRTRLTPDHLVWL